MPAHNLLDIDGISLGNDRTVIITRDTLGRLQLQDQSTTKKLENIREIQRAGTVHEAFLLDGNKWKNRTSKVFFDVPIDPEPTGIVFTNVVAEGVTPPRVDRITKTYFSYAVKVFRGNIKDPVLHFNWEAVLP